MLPLLRTLLIAAALGLWWFTQSLLARRNTAPDAAPPPSPICDGIHTLTAPLHARLFASPKLANLLLVSSSAVIDALGLTLLASSIFGPTIEPFLGLFIVFALRQLAQAFCPLPPPEGMIWRHPGVPSLLVTYGTANDLFFSGHTAIAVYGALTLPTLLGPQVGIPLGLAVAIFEVGAVLLLRAHYTMDVFTGLLAALYTHHLAHQLAPTVDALLHRLTA